MKTLITLGIAFLLVLLLGASIAAADTGDLGFDPTWLVTLLAAVGGVVAHAVLTKQQPWNSPLTIVDLIVISPLAMLIPTGLSVAPLQFLKDLGTKLNSPADQILVVLPGAFILAFIWAQRGREQVLIWLGDQVQKKLTTPCVALAVLAAFLMVLATPTPAPASDMPCPWTFQSELTSLGQEQITGITTGTAKGLTASVYSPTGGIPGQAAIIALVTLETNSARTRMDGTAATSTSTLRQPSSSSFDGQFYVCGAAAIKNFSIIGAGGTAVITVDYWRVAR